MHLLQQLYAIYFLQFLQDGQCSCMTCYNQQQKSGVILKLKISRTELAGSADCASGLRNKICYTRTVSFYLFIVP